MAVPPESTNCPPPLTVAALAVAPDKTSSSPPLRTATPEAVLPCRRTIMPASVTVAPAAGSRPLTTPPEDTYNAPPLLRTAIDGRWLAADGVVARRPANSLHGDDIEVYTDDTRTKVAFTWYGLRQQGVKPVVDGVPRPNQCLADFIAPKSSSMADYIGVFAVTAGLGIEKYEKRFEDAHDDYSSIMLKALADRLAEAFAEYLHERVRTDLWGYAPAENLTKEQMIGEQYDGVRPAPGYPACPEHTVKKAMFDVLQAEEIGMELTESFAMYPGAAVSGFYMAHPQSKYFVVGKIGNDQVEDMAKRRGASKDDVERWLAPNLA